MLKRIGITNQRETTLVWDRSRGEPVRNANQHLDSNAALRPPNLHLIMLHPSGFGG